MKETKTAILITGAYGGLGQALVEIGRSIEDTDRIIATDIDNEIEKKIKDTVLMTYRVLRCKDWSRIDVRLDKNGVPKIIEINPLPGIMPDPNENSSFPKAARAAGMNYNQMIQKVLYAAAKRYKLA